LSIKILAELINHLKTTALNYYINLIFKTTL